MRRSIPSWSIGVVLLAVTSAFAQMPGMEPPAKAEPAAILFQNIIINYTLDQEHMLDEVPVRLTFDSDWDHAKEIMVAAAKKVTQGIINKTGEEPFIRAEFLDWGILVRLRYQTIPAKRQEISTNIIEILLHDFGKEFPKVRFAIPSQTIRYRPDLGIPGPRGEAEMSASSVSSPTAPSRQGERSW